MRYACISSHLLMCNVIATHLVACNKTRELFSQSEIQARVSWPQLPGLLEVCGQGVDQGWGSPEA